MGKPLFLNANQSDEKMVYLRIMSYRDSNAIYAVLVGAELKYAGVPVRTITTKPDQELPVFHSAVNPADKDVAQMLIDLGIAKPTNELVYAGFRSLYVFAFNKEALMEYDPQGVQDYEERINKRGEKSDDCD